MRVLYAIGAPAPLGRTVCAVGSFDGVHREHQQLAARTAALARAEGVPAAAVVVWEGERQDGGSDQQQLLTLLDERLELLRGLELFDAALVISRAPDAKPIDADSVLGAIVRRTEPVAVLASDDSGGGGIAAAAALRGIRASEDVAHAVDGSEHASVYPSEHDEARQRTSIGERIADVLLAGEVRDAAMLLGHPYTVTGEVVGGDRRGRVLGYPTANLRLDARKRLPANGIYAVWARLPGESDATHPAVASLGVRPQFGANGPRLLEVYLLDAALDLYGLALGVEFVERLREERRFADVEALKAQMGRDVETARDLLRSVRGMQRGREMDVHAMRT